MARTFEDSEQTSAVAPESASVETPEATVTEDTNETPAAPEAGQEAATTETVDVAALQAAFEEAVTQALLNEGRDEDTGTLPVAAIDPVKVAYSALPTRGKTSARDYVQSEMTKAMMGDGGEQDFGAARSLLEILNALKTAATKVTVTKEPVDPTQAFVARVVSLMLSPNFVPVPAGVKDGWQQLVQNKAQQLGANVHAYKAWLEANGDKPTEEQSAAPEVDDIVLSALAIAKGRGSSATRKGGSGATSPKVRTATAPGAPRRDIAAHITSAFADVESGTFLSIGEIVKKRSEEYGDDEPSQGAIAARLFPGGDASKCNVPGVRPEQRDKKGAVKL
jgi:hypothetical protein